MSTTFFTELLPFLQQHDLKIDLSLKDGKIHVDILPDLKDEEANKQLKTFSLQGTPEEFNAEFFEKMQLAYIDIPKGLRSNAQAAGESLVAAEKEKEGEGDTEKKPAVKKPTSAKKPVQKAPVKKASGSKKTIKEQVEEALAAGHFKKAQEIVDKARKGGGLRKDKVEELAKLVIKKMSEKKPAGEKAPKEAEKETAKQLDLEKEAEKETAPKPEEKPLRYSTGELQEFRTLLGKQLADISDAKQTAEEREKAIDQEISETDDEVKIQELMTEKTSVMLTKMQKQKEIPKYKQALERVEEGTYGYCQTSNTLIPMEELKANPLLTINPKAK